MSVQNCFTRCCFQSHRNVPSANRIIVCVIALVWSLLAGGVASAHGDGGLPRLQNQPLGPNRLHAWTSPAIPRTGEIHVETLVTDEGLYPVAQQRTIVTVTPLFGKGEPQRVIAQAPTNAARQEAAFLLSKPGMYRVDITVIAAAGTGGRHGFEIQVIAVQRWVKTTLQGLLVTISAIGLWLLIQGREFLRHTTPEMA